VLYDQHAPGRKQPRRQCQRFLETGIVVRRIEVGDIEAPPGGRESPEAGAHVIVNDLGGVGPGSQLQILGDEAKGCRLALQEDRRRAPRLNASQPTAPVPAYASRNRAASMRAPRMSNSPSRTLSEVGRVRSPLGAFSRRPLASPPVSRTTAPCPRTTGEDYTPRRSPYLFLTSADLTGTISRNFIMELKFPACDS